MNKNRKLTVTVGIPAYNEEANIKKLLLSLLSQKIDSGRLIKIVVTSDASTDRTVDEAKSLKSTKITVLDHSERKGQALRQQELFDLNTSDILILLNADVLPSDKHFLENIVTPFLENKDIGVVGADITPLRSKTYFERVINYSIFYKRTMFENINNGDSILLCHGRARAFSKQFIRKFKWQQIINEDAYTYLECKRLGFAFHYQPSARVYYRSPQTLKDHIRQSQRFLIAKNELYEFYDKKILEDSYHIPLPILYTTFIQFFFRNPTVMMGYVGIVILSMVSVRLLPFYRVNFEPSTSSKQL